MKRYNQLFEYDPFKMRALVGNPERPVPKSSSNKNLPDWVIEDNLTQGDASVGYLASEVKPTINFVSTKKANRIVLYKGDIYTTDTNHVTHLNLICWLIMNKGLVISEEELFGWEYKYATSVPFICLAQDYENPELIYFSESYNYHKEKELVKYRDAKFKKEIKKLEQKGFIIKDIIIVY